MLVILIEAMLWLNKDSGMEKNGVKSFRKGFYVRKVKTENEAKLQENYE